ncbi:MAG: hypothetical protein M1838_005251 [Thelocarpon superellum]|nr:MAG: hypothetical protein M1838_005251 [Thelocarpon superellum]
MGNNPSKSNPTTSPSATTPHTTASSSSSSTPAVSSSTPTRLEPRRRDSVQALPSGKATAAPPSESHESATSHHSSAAPPHSKIPARPRARTVESTQPGPMGNEESRLRAAAAANDQKPFNPTRPIAVPSTGESSRGDGSTIQPAAPPHDQYHIPPIQAHRPPRLPLPIEEEIHAPGSPIISSADLSSALEEDEADGSLRRRNSVLSSTTVDDDEAEVGDDLHAYSVDGEMRKTVPTMIEWQQGGDKVYVTGTFASWNRKFRLHKEANSDRLSAVIQLPPGTHHLKFIVDGDMRISDHMPTAVDYTNILVNYVEVSADDIPATVPPSTTPVDIKSTEGRPGQDPAHSAALPAGTPSAAAGSHGADAAADSGRPPAATSQPAGPDPSTKIAARPKRWTNKIPRYLLDLDQPEDSPAYQRASSAISALPPPPSLPLFLNRSILNGNTPMKDDSSVLSMPNHTVLNHLATSSIRSGVLATSATTRYKKKHVTTVLYKPTNEDED